MTLLESFEDWTDTRTLAAGDVIFSANDPADTLYLILDGEVALTLRGEALSSERRGAIIGEMAIIDDNRHSTTATALTDVRLARIAPDQLRRLVGDDPGLSLHAMAELAKRLRAVDALLGARFARPDHPVTG